MMERCSPSTVTAVENKVANSLYQRSALDWLIYNDPLAYTELILNGDPELLSKSCNGERAVRLTQKKIREKQYWLKVCFSRFYLYSIKHVDYLLAFVYHVVHITNDLGEYAER